MRAKVYFCSDCLVNCSEVLFGDYEERPFHGIGKVDFLLCDKQLGVGVDLKSDPLVLPLYILACCVLACMVFWWIIVFMILLSCLPRLRRLWAMARPMLTTRRKQMPILFYLLTVHRFECSVLL